MRRSSCTICTPIPASSTTSPPRGRTWSPRSRPTSKRQGPNRRRGRSGEVRRGHACGSLKLLLHPLQFVIRRDRAECTLLRRRRRRLLEVLAGARLASVYEMPHPESVGDRGKLQIVFLHQRGDLCFGLHAFEEQQPIEIR